MTVYRTHLCGPSRCFEVKGVGRKETLFLLYETRELGVGVPTFVQSYCKGDTIVRCDGTFLNVTLTFRLQRHSSLFPPTLLT